MCQVHRCNSGTGRCDCPAPYTLFTFPTEATNISARREWSRRLQRKDQVTGKNWTPKADDRICSLHFVDGAPSLAHPNPSLHLGHQQAQVTRHRLPPTHLMI